MPSINNSFATMNTSAKAGSASQTTAQSADQTTTESPFKLQLNNEINKTSNGSVAEMENNQALVDDVVSEIELLQEENSILPTGNSLPIEDPLDELLTAAADSQSVTLTSADNAMASSILTSALADDVNFVDVSKGAVDISKSVVDINNDVNEVDNVDTLNLSANAAVPALAMAYIDQSKNTEAAVIAQVDMSKSRQGSAVTTPDLLKFAMNNNNQGKNIEVLQAEADSDTAELEMDVFSQNENIEELELELKEVRTQNQSNSSVGVKQEMSSADLARFMRTATVASTSAASDSVKMPADTFTTSQLDISTPVGHKQWGAELSQRINVMVNNAQLQVAEMRLNPAHLGPVSVRLEIEDDKASISFVTNHNAVKEAVEQSLPKLREQLQEQGLDLAHVDVSARDSENSASDSNSEGDSQNRSNGLSEQEQTIAEAMLTLETPEGVSIFV